MEFVVGFCYLEPLSDAAVIQFVWLADWEIAEVTQRRRRKLGNIMQATVRCV